MYEKCFILRCRVPGFKKTTEMRMLYRPMFWVKTLRDGASSKQTIRDMTDVEKIRGVLKTGKIYLKS